MKNFLPGCLPTVPPLVVLVLSLSNNTAAQIVPYSPLFPTSPRECQAFSRQVQEYEASYSAQHEQCLATHPVDRQEAPNSPTCSRSSCQYLHDMLYGDSSLSVRSLRAEVEACNEKVAKHLDEEAEEKANQEEREARQARRQEERQKEEADRAARGQQEKDARDTQRASDEAARKREAADLSATEQKAGADRYAQLQAIAAAANRQTIARSPSTGPESKLQPEASASLVNPYETAQTPELSSELVYPFARNETLTEPFALSDSKKLDLASAEVDKFTYEASKKILEESLSRIDAVLTQDIRGVQSQIGKTISAGKADQQIQEIRDTQSVLHGLTHIMSGAQYAVLVKNIVSAEGPGKRDEATGEALKQIASDALHRDAVTNGITEVSLRLFGERVGPLLVRAAAPTFAAGGILLDSEKTGRDPVEIIHDTSGKVSLPEKQSALMEEWRGYERRQSQTSHDQNLDLRRALWIDSNIVYNQCLEAKLVCDKWQPPTANK